MATREELLGDQRWRYAKARRVERRRILDEFVAVSGYHWKHTIRLLRSLPRRADRQSHFLVLDAAVRAALVVL